VIAAGSRSDKVQRSASGRENHTADLVQDVSEDGRSVMTAGE
jgi:hypothetical protein